jgi:methyl-accepting chemotaxis protein
MVNLETTNWLLGVIALASAVQMLAIIGMGIAGYRMYRRTTELYQQTSETLAQLEVRHIAPLRQQVDAILGNVHAVTSRVSHQTQRADDAITSTIDRVDETAERVKHSVRDKVSQVTGVVRGVRAVIMSLLTNDAPPKPRAEAGGHA